MTESKPSVEAPDAAAATMRRRSRRIQIEIPIIVRAGAGPSSIDEHTKTVHVNTYGCLIYVKAHLVAGQEVSIINPATREKVACTVSFLGKMNAGLLEVGLEFTQPSPFFWRIHFPPENWNPAERKLPSGVNPSPSTPPRSR